MADNRILGLDNSILGGMYLLLVAAMFTASLLVTNLGIGFNQRFVQLAIAAVLGIFWTGYFAWSMHPKIVEHALGTEDEPGTGDEG